MDRVFVILLLAAAALSVAVSAEDDGWLPGWGWSESPPPPKDGSPPPLYPSPTVPDYPPSPYYDSPPPSEPPYPDKEVPLEELFEDEDGEADDIGASSYFGSPSYNSPLGAPLYDSAPSYHDISWMTDRLVENPDLWPSPWTSTTTVEEAFGPDAEKVYGSVSLLDGLSSKGDDGFSKLLKEGITALLNAIDKHFKIAEDEVKKCFSMHKSLASEEAAANQASVFAEANAEYAASHG